MLDKSLELQYIPLYRVSLDIWRLLLGYIVNPT